MSHIRKVQKIGGSLYTSIPKKLVEELQLDQNIEVEILLQPDDSIALYPRFTKSRIEEKTLLVDAKEFLPSLKRRMIGAYVDGFDLIKLKSDDGFSVQQQAAVRDQAEALFGLEIVEITSDVITLQCLTEVLPIEQTVKRINKTLSAVLVEALSALRDGKILAVESAVNRMQDVKRLILVLHRLLKKQILFPSRRSIEMKTIDCVDFLRVIDKISEISKEIKKIIESVSRIAEKPVPNNILEPIHKLKIDVQDIYDKSINSFMYSDVSLANSVLDTERRINFDNLWYLLLESSAKTEISTSTFSELHRIVDDLKQIHVYTIEISEIAIDRAEY